MVLTGWNGSSESTVILNTVLVFGAITTFLTTIDILMKTETKKNTYKLMLLELREVRSELVVCDDLNSEGLDKITVDKLKSKYHEIMGYSKALIGKESQ
ncbi:MAG: hypothetical protein HRU15_02020 [Planctomycetes bacterium]|nr:hypothetical protein [Planctomycetota bacterium]